MSSTGSVLATTTSAVQPGSARALTITLQSGNYRFTVQASNKVGSGPQSARSNLVVAQ
jgi:P pilus assembly chaperone PapD